jgi:hypothetical protein
MACDDLSAATAIVVLGVEDVGGESATPPQPVVTAPREMTESFTLLTQVASADHLRSMPLAPDDEIRALLNEPTSLAWLSGALEQRDRSRFRLLGDVVPGSRCGLGSSRGA